MFFRPKKRLVSRELSGLELDRGAGRPTAVTNAIANAVAKKCRLRSENYVWHFKIIFTWFSPS